MRLSGGRLALIWAHLQEAGVAATYNEVVLTATAAIAATTAINIQTGAPSADVDGDIFLLPATALEFNEDAKVEIHMNGNKLHKGVDVFWASTTQVTLACPLRVGGKLTVARIIIP